MNLKFIQPNRISEQPAVRKANQLASYRKNSIAQLKRLTLLRSQVQHSKN